MLTLWTRTRANRIIGLLVAAVVVSTGMSSSSAAPAPSAQKVVAPAKDATLKSLTVTSPANITLTPKFAAATVAYAATVPAGTQAVTFKAVPTQAKAVVAISAPKPLVPGANKVTITVTATDKKTKKVYTVTVTVLRLATVTPGAVETFPGGFQVRTTVLNATIVPLPKLTSTEPRCVAAQPVVSVSAPDANNSVVIKVQGVRKNCEVSLEFIVTPNSGYSAAAVTPLRVTPTQDKVEFFQDPVVSTDDGFTVTFKVVNATVLCESGSSDNPEETTVTNTQTELAVTGLNPNTSATVMCTFTPDGDDVVNIDPVTITGRSLALSSMVVGEPVKQESGFAVGAAVGGCVPAAEVVDGPDAARVARTGPVGNVYTFTVTGVQPGGEATITITCDGLPGLFSDADPVDVTGTTISATELGLKTAPRVAVLPASVTSTTTEDDLPDVTPGKQPAMLYATTPEWGPWAAAGKNTFAWQVSASDYDDEGIPCNDPLSQVDWIGPLTTGVKADSPRTLNVGTLLALKPYVGRCVRVQVTGVYGSRSGTVTSAGVALASVQPPTQCTQLPTITSNSGNDYAVRGDELTTTAGRCVRAVGLAVSYRWQVSAVTTPTRAQDWQTVTGTTPSVSVVTSMQGRWIRSIVTYTADSGSTAISSPIFAIAGKLSPVSNTKPLIAGGGVGVRQARFTLADLGDWSRAAGSAMTVVWQYSTDGENWEDQQVFNANGDEVLASTVFYARKAGSYRARVTFGSQTGDFDDVSAESNVLTWAPSAG